MPNFTQDWFSNNIPGMNQMLARVPEKKRFLEIGSFEGMSTCWFLTQHLADDGTIVCIDTFAGGIEHIVTKFEGVADRFRANVAEMKKPTQTVIELQMESYQGLGQLIHEGQQFDFIYIDGSHTAPDVLSDACMAFRLLKKGGVMVFDDYVWGSDKPLLETPKLAVDMFTAIYREQLAIVMLSYQLAVQKLV